VDPTQSEPRVVLIMIAPTPDGTEPSRHQLTCIEADEDRFQVGDILDRKRGGAREGAHANPPFWQYARDGRGGWNQWGHGFDGVEG
jgi:hypothetical protein